MPQADYTYDTEADCFVITDERGNELCRTRSPHQSTDRDRAVAIVDWFDRGILIFPTAGDTSTPQCPTK